MILIFSEKNDISAAKTKYWLDYFDTKYIYLEDFYLMDMNFSVVLKNDKQIFTFKYKNETISMDDIHVVWNRRGKVRFESIPSNLINPLIAPQALNNHFYEEQKALADYFYDQLSLKTCISLPTHYFENKLIALYKAQHLGIAVPETIVTNKASVLKRENSYVSKNLQDIFIYSTAEHCVADSVKEANLQKNEYRDTFFYSLFQQRIHPEVEIRTFFFLDLWFSVAIFPAKTLDYRENITKSPPVIVPYKLPKPYQRKLRALMKQLKLNTGSIDTLYDGTDYFFLEVNPVGQFDFVSGIGNYYVERAIALKLKQLDEK